MTGNGLDARDLLAGMILEDGRTWGEAAEPWQLEDAEAVLSPAGIDGAPRRFFHLRGRGMSKTTDAAGLNLALLIAEAPPKAHAYCYAADADQAGLMLEALAGLVARTPGLAGAVDVGARAVTVRATGAVLTIEASDGASSFGPRPWLVTVDELGAWPQTANHRQLWASIVSGIPKVPGARLLVIGTAGSPTGLGAKVWAGAEASAQWRTSRHPGPSPWWTPDDIEATRADLTPSEWRRLILCEWAEGDDALTTVQDVEAAIRAGSATLEPRPGVSYVAALDVGTRRDLTALVVGHAEHRDAGRVVVIDRVLYWRPARGAGGRVDLTEVEAAALRVCRAYGARLRFDRMQAEQLTANLSRAGVRVEEFVFSSAGASKLARSLWGALRDRSLSLPDDAEIRQEFLATRMVETGPGVLKIQNPPGQHDDVVTAVGMVVADLLDQPDLSGGSITVPGWSGRSVGRSVGSTGRPTVPPPDRQAVARAARAARHGLIALPQAKPQRWSNRR